MARTKSNPHHSKETQYFAWAQTDKQAPIPASPAGITKSTKSKKSKKSTKATKPEIRIRKGPFKYLVMDITLGFNPYLRMQSSAIQALHEAGDVLLNEMLHDVYLCAAHDGRVSVKSDDYKLAKRVSKSAWAVFAK